MRCHAAALEIAEPTARHHTLHRDGLLSTLDRPRWHAHYRNSDLIDQAAVLAEGLVASDLSPGSRTPIHVEVDTPSGLTRALGHVGPHNP